jgi:tRNA nucleotidyltransferase (CCA-adding enzyme)
MALTNGVELVNLKYLVDRYLDPKSQVAHPTPLMSGHELMQALSLPPSPTIGKLLTEIQVARITENITTNVEAIDFATKFLKSIDRI